MKLFTYLDVQLSVYNNLTLWNAEYCSNQISLDNNELTDFGNLKLASTFDQIISKI